MEETKNLAVVNEFTLPALNNDMGEAMAEEMDGLPTSFDRVKIPTGGGLTFEIPGDDPNNPDIAKEIVGVIVDHHPINAYWKEKFEGQNNPPDCSSLDGKRGIGVPGGNCKNCPYNQFGSAADGKGKACKNMHRVYILRSGEAFPLLLTLPPTSIKPFADYLAKRIITKGLRSYGVITKITLKKATNNSGIVYSQAQFQLESILDQNLVEQLKAYSQGIKATTRQIDIEDSDVIEVENPQINEENMPF
ncbi:hypothetical protein [Caldanaerobius polysaccharolyticus]|uniref:hypothetical protein n=1 Tax=Caldanaerobius polysaccharolyticus TaxID=44256 RepID=UPI00047A5BC2|nr:hypothetical protein [Caldanaerobius polysaccharolyticus]